MKHPRGLPAILIAVGGLVSAVASMYGLVPRIRLVDALGLFATAFAAGAGLAVAIMDFRRRTVPKDHAKPESAVDPT